MDPALGAVSCQLCLRTGGNEDPIAAKVSLIPETVQEIRVVDIVGLDKQADGGTHVRSTAEVGRLKVIKLENKGKGNKRVRVEIVDP
ncbi:MAG: hypothetical protein KGR47_03235 [Acidobacteria bacterium]|nr:hypothetical protein [Acidobacteriota bacterium]